MAGSSKPSQGQLVAKSSSPRGATNQQSQIDFEIDFFRSILRGYPDYVEVLRILGNNLTIKGRLREGLDVDQRLVRLRPHDCLAHYNLACTLALLGRTDDALAALRRAIERGYHDFNYMQQDRDLDSLRGDPRYRKLMAQFSSGSVAPAQPTC